MHGGKSRGGVKGRRVDHAMGGRHARPGWTKISIAVGSGAAETVIPHTLVTSHPIEATAKSRAGVCYASATGAPIPNLGQQQLPMAMAEGSLRMMTFQAAPVAKPLASVAKICMAGHVVVFDDGASYILNKTTRGHQLVARGGRQLHVGCMDPAGEGHVR